MFLKNRALIRLNHITRALNVGEKVASSTFSTSASNSNKNLITKAHFPYSKIYATRWVDNDVYGHVNNVKYLEISDSIINRYLIKHCGQNVGISNTIGYIVKNVANYYKPISYPSSIFAGLKVKRIGNSSVEYEIGIFEEENDDCCAIIETTHVFVNRTNEKPEKISGKLKQGLEKIYK